MGNEYTNCHGTGLAIFIGILFLTLFFYLPIKYLIERNFWPKESELYRSLSWTKAAISIPTFIFICLGSILSFGLKQENLIFIPAGILAGSLWDWVSMFIFAKTGGSFGKDFSEIWVGKIFRGALAANILSSPIPIGLIWLGFSVEFM